MSSGYVKPVIDRDFINESSIIISNNHKHLPIKQQQQLLPIYNHKNNILYAVENYLVSIIVGETGTGKSTQIPLYLYEAGWSNGSVSIPNTSIKVNRCIVCTQPRRLAAINVAIRVAEEFGCTVGAEVGYNVRFNSKVSDLTRIKYVTDGVLLRETLQDPLLSKYSVIVVDEAHERTLQSDMLLGILKKILKHRNDLHVIITSATMNALAIRDFFQFDNKPDSTMLLSIQGRQHPVDIQYLEKSTSNYVLSSVETVLLIHKYEDYGDILIFLPGSEEIDRAIQLLEEHYNDNDLLILPLHSNLSNYLQQRVFEITPYKKRKVIFSTNIAETSITIEGIKYVIDCGFIKQNYFDYNTGIDYLITCPISKPTAIQRAGRAGRTESGKCYRLYTEETYTVSLIDHNVPEMQRIDITTVVLQLKAIGIDNILRFDFISPPNSLGIIYSLEMLYSLHAIDNDGKLTELGLKIATMPIDPKLGRCLLYSYELGCSEEMLTIAAMCSVDYPFITIKSSNNSNNQTKHDIMKNYWDTIRDFVHLDGDHLTLLNVYNHFIDNNKSNNYCKENYLNYNILMRANEIRNNLKKLLKLYISSSTDSEAVLASCGDDTIAIRKCILSGYFSNIAKLKSDGNYYTHKGNVLVMPYIHSIYVKFGTLPEWIVYHDIVHTKNTLIRDITRINPLWLIEVANHYYQVNKSV